MSLQISKRPGRRGGRRPGAGRKKGVPTEVIAVRLPKPMVAKLKREAKKRGLAIGKLIEAMLGKAVIVREHKWRDATVIDVEN